jgi:hypothetical protein
MGTVGASQQGLVWSVGGVPGPLTPLTGKAFEGGSGRGGKAIWLGGIGQATGTGKRIFRLAPTSQSNLAGVRIVKNAFRLQETVSSPKGKRFAIPNRETVRFLGARSFLATLFHTASHSVQSGFSYGLDGPDGRTGTGGHGPKGRASRGTWGTCLPCLSLSLSLALAFLLSHQQFSPHPHRRRSPQKKNAAGGRYHQQQQVSATIYTVGLGLAWGERARLGPSWG